MGLHGSVCEYGRGGQVAVALAMADELFAVTVMLGNVVVSRRAPNAC